MAGRKGNMSECRPTPLELLYFCIGLHILSAILPVGQIFPLSMQYDHQHRPFNSNCSILIRNLISCCFWTCGRIPQGKVMCTLSCTDAGNCKCLVSIKTRLALCTSNAMHYDFLYLQCQMTKCLESTVGCWMYIFKYSNFSFYKREILNFCINSLKTVITAL